MPIGICSASEVLQKRTYKSFGDIDGVLVIADDMIITSESEEEHDEILRKVLARARQHNIKFNPKKIQLKKSEVVYMGNVLTEHGIKPDEMKVQSSSGYANIHQQGRCATPDRNVKLPIPYIPNMPEITSPIRSLLKNNVQFQWLPEHSLAFDEIKEVLKSDPVLQFYDSNKAVTIQCNASKSGLGVCLLQEGWPVAYASRSLTETEQQWFQIEKELLSIVFCNLNALISSYMEEKLKLKMITNHSRQLWESPSKVPPPKIQPIMLRLLRYKL